MNGGHHIIGLLESGICPGCGCSLIPDVGKAFLRVPRGTVHVTMQDASALSAGVFPTNGDPEKCIFPRLYMGRLALIDGHCPDCDDPVERHPFPWAAEGLVYVNRPVETGSAAVHLSLPSFVATLGRPRGAGRCLQPAWFGELERARRRR